MHQTRKGNQWYFGMKGHFGVESRTKLILELSHFSGEFQAWAVPWPERIVSHTGSARDSQSPTGADAGYTSPR